MKIFLSFLATSGTFNFEKLLSGQTKLNETPLKELFSRGLTGIHELLDEITETKGETILRIEQGDNFIYLDNGDKSLSHIFFALVVKKEMNSFKYFLNEVKTSFQNSYKGLLENFTIFADNQEPIFLNFNNNLITLLE